MTSTDLLSILPFLVIVAWASALLLVDVFYLSASGREQRKGLAAILAALGLAITLVVVVVQSGDVYLGFGGLVSYDGFASFLNVLFLGAGLMTVAQSYDYLKRMEINAGEFYPLLLYIIGGMMLMASANDLIIVFLSLELFSIPLYVMAGIARNRTESEESAMKYFLLGAFASSFIVYGIALVYAATGTTSLPGVIGAFQAGSASNLMLIIGAGMIFVSLGFKVGAVPFHMWTPDVYQGAPSVVTSFMAVGAKAAGFAGLMRVFFIAFAGTFEVAEGLTDVLWAVSIATMVLGNLLAISQKNIKRMLAYSSIAQAGYLLMGVVAFSNAEIAGDAIASILFYLVAFALTSFGVWAVVMSLEQKEDDENGGRKGLLLTDYAGLARKNPALAALMAIFMLSLIGLPPTLGFAGKLYLFRVAIDGGFLGLALIGVLTSLISAYYYLRVVVLMYMHDGSPKVHSDRWMNLTAAIAAGCTVVLTIFASPLFSWAANAILVAF